MPESLPIITLNGARRTLAPGDTVTHLVAAATGHEVTPAGEITTARRLGLAVAVNSRVVPRSLWASTALTAGDEVELVSAAQGG